MRRLVGTAIATGDPEDLTVLKAIDSNSSTFWLSPESSTPASLTVAMGRDLQIAGFAYLPRQDSNTEGVVNSYRFETSTDGQTWTVNVADGRFDNIKNNPVWQTASFAPVTARYFRFTALSDVNGKLRASVAEITVLPSGN